MLIKNKEAGDPLAGKASSASCVDRENRAERLTPPFLAREGPPCGLSEQLCKARGASSREPSDSAVRFSSFQVTGGMG